MLIYLFINHQLSSQHFSEQFLKLNPDVLCGILNSLLHDWLILTSSVFFLFRTDQEAHQLIQTLTTTTIDQSAVTHQGVNCDN